MESTRTQWSMQYGVRSIGGQGCLEYRHMGPALSGERAKVSKEPATLINVPIIQKSPWCVRASVTKLLISWQRTKVDVGWDDPPASREFTSNTSVLRDGKLDIPDAQTIAHYGYYSYTVVKETRKRHMRHDYPRISDDVWDRLEGIRKGNQDA